MISTQIPKSMIKRTSVFYVLSEGIIVSADIQSKSRPNLTHYTRLVLDPLTLKTVKATCDCEAGSFGKKCWHVRALEELVITDEKIKEEVEKARNELMQIEEDIASWG